MILSTYVTFKGIKEHQGKTRIKSTEHVLQLPTTKNQLSFTKLQEIFREYVVLPISTMHLLKRKVEAKSYTLLKISLVLWKAKC